MWRQLQDAAEEDVADERAMPMDREGIVLQSDIPVLLDFATSGILLEFSQLRTSA